MKTQTTPKMNSRQKAGENMNLLALLFFMMGAVHVYGHLQGSDNQVTSNVNSLPLLKVGLFAMLVAGLIEVLVI